MSILISGSTGNGNFELSGSDTDHAASWTFAGYAGDAVGRNAGASAPNGTGAFTISSAGSVSGSASAVNAVATVVGHDYSATLNLKYGSLHGAVVLTIGEGSPITAASGSGAGTTVRSATWQATGTSFSVVVAPAGVNDIGYVDDIILTDVGVHVSASGSVGVSMSGTGHAGSGSVTTYYHSGSSASVVFAASPGYTVSQLKVDGSVVSVASPQVFLAMNTDHSVEVTATRNTQNNLSASTSYHISIPQFQFSAEKMRIGKFVYTAGVSDDVVTSDAGSLFSQKVINHLMLLDAAGFSWFLTA